jgi:hypothetical protein
MANRWKDVLTSGMPYGYATGDGRCGSEEGRKSMASRKERRREMSVIHRTTKPVSVLVAVLVFLTGIPCGPALGAMIGTGTALDPTRVQEGRQYLGAMAAREHVQRALVAQGIAPEEATLRIGALSDHEVIRLAETIQQMPAGGNGAAVLVAVAIIFGILVITDALGFTDIFPWVR